MWKSVKRYKAGHRMVIRSGMAAAMVAFSASAAPALADGLPELLESVPATAPLTGTGEWLRYSDVTQLDFGGPRQLRGAALLPYDFWTAAEESGTGGAPLLELVGLPLSAFTGIVSFDLTRDPMYVYGVQADQLSTDAMDGPMTASGFELADRDGVPVFQWLGDGEDESARRDFDHPFTSRWSAPARVAVLDDRLAHAEDWSGLDTILATHAGRYPSMADRPDIAALTTAFANRGRIVQAMMTATMVNHAVWEFRAQTQTADPDGTDAVPPAVPPFALLGLADLDLASGSAGALGLVYRDEETARQAAEALDRAFGVAIRPSDGRPVSEPLTEGWQVAVEPADDMVTVIMTFPDPAAADQRGYAFNYLFALVTRGALPVAVADGP